MGRSSGLQPRPGMRACVCGVWLVCSSLLPCVPSSTWSPSPFLSPSSHCPYTSPHSPFCSPLSALQLRIILPVPGHLYASRAMETLCPRSCILGGAVRCREGKKKGRGQELQEAGASLQSPRRQFEEIMNVRCFTPSGAHSRCLIRLRLLPPSGVWKEQG